VAGLAASCLVCLAAGPLRAQERHEPAAIAAAYLRYIAEFTTWPADSFPDADAPVVIAVLGDDASGVVGIMRRAIEGKGLSAQSRRLVLRELAPLGVDGGAEGQERLREGLGGAHLLFLSRSERAHWSTIRTLVSSQPIVTVSEIEGFATARGMIEFVVDPDENRVVMHIDLDAVRRAGLQLSSRLLGLKQGVKIVKSPNDTSRCLGSPCRRGPRLRPLSLARHPGRGLR
jgi:hypothetical protein